MARLATTRARVRPSVAGILAIALAILLAGLNAPRTAAHPIDPTWAPPPTVYIPETGHTLDRLFLDLWRAGGGANSWGYPITPEITLDNGHIIQYLEYARFEYWPEGDESGNVVVLGTIGAELQPPIVRRSVTTFGAPDPSASEAAIAAAKAARAWLPIDREGFGPDTASWRYVPETGHSVSFGFKDFWEATGEAAYLGNPLTEEYEIAGTTYQVFERGQLAWRPDADPWMVPVGELLAKRYGLDTSPEPQGDIPIYDEALFVPQFLTPGQGPPPPPGYERSIVVSLSQQALWAYEGSTVVLSTFVSTGKEGFATPAGLFFVNYKLPVQDMEGVIGGEYYDVPQVPDVMYFTDRGHAIHGTYWHDNFGAPMSHGCVNVPMGTSLWLYEWAPVGTPMLIVP